MDLLIAGFTGLLIGLAGSVHCLAMCGPLASGLAFGFSADRRQGRQAIQTLLTIGLGKVGLYALLGLGFAAIGQQLLPDAWLAAVLMVNGILLVIMGLYGLGLRGPNQAIERLFSPISRPLLVLNKRLLPIDSSRKALLWGALWGLLPCGLVYTALVWSLTLPSPMAASLGMLCFGLGTLPAALGSGYLGLKLTLWLKRGWLGKLSGALLLAMGWLAIALGFAQI